MSRKDVHWRQDKTFLPRRRYPNLTPLEIRADEGVPGEPQNLVDLMVDYLETISTKAFQSLKETCFTEVFEHLEALDAPGFSPREAFHSSLRKTDLSQENYECLRQVWRENGMSNLRDLLTWYKNKDTRAFIEVLEKPCDFHKTLGLDMLKDSGIPKLRGDNGNLTQSRGVRRQQSVSVGSSTGNVNSLNLWALAQEMSTVCICGLYHRKCQQSESVGSSTGNVNSLNLWALAQEMSTVCICGL
ncbi:hypothetical protein RRG08_014311 [Elysia crispata]|uniref:Uncharacterized protein n=1 Tax=Elysia crispata TaxID=231223 RepID=A0AAE0Z253_9GAST|nr:hypothetical protein RRG08_014311 [Elysia crispata]